jgi:hypothetical protein
MTMRRSRIALVVLITTILAGLVTVAAWQSARSFGRTAHPGAGVMGDGSATGMMGGPGMMGGGAMMGGYNLPGDGARVDSLDAARQRAQSFADRLGLQVGEVMQFDNGFYVELRTATGQGATEVLVDVAGGAVRLEFGPAMMWNTGYGMHAGSVAGSERITPSEARDVAQRWLDGQRPGLSAGEAERFPGYYTLHTTRGGTIVGMLSVNAYTGAVWYHTWHGAYVAMSED